MKHDRSTQMNYDLIIFDCDGVLIDSELLANRSEVDFLKSLGIKFDLSDYMSRFVGKSNQDVLNSIESLHNICLPENFWALAERQTFQVFRDELQPMIGVLELISSLDTAKCIASSSSLQRLEVTLKATGLFDRFLPHIFSAEQVDHGKPAPDLFLWAADQMQVNPNRCLVIEDSPYGVRAGVEADMTVLGFTGGSHIQPGHQEKLLQAGAVKVFSEMSQISAWLGE
jgi:HAD superfamily hydrolase (TIGR01509 family)